MVKNKEIQEQRMKSYFIEAAAEILKSEGIRGASVRNIAERAGYSYATLYNYFKDVNDVIFLCVNKFQNECFTFVEANKKSNNKGIEQIKSCVIAFIDYFVEYPGIFELFYLTPMGDFGNKQSTIDIITTSLASICEGDVNYCIKQKIVDKSKSKALQEQLNIAVVGLLVMFLNRRTPASYTDFKNHSNTIIDGILNSFQ